MSLARAKAKQILKDLHIDRPKLLGHLKEICCERGAYVREVPLENAEARLTVSGDRGIITVRPNDSYRARTRFSIAHELGHFELHRKRAKSLKCDPSAISDDQLEIEANEFAAELLMPEDFLRVDLEHHRPSIGFILGLAEKYQTSLFATTKRFIDLTREACAAVFYRNGVVSYVWKSKLLEEQGYRIEGTLDPYSYAHDVSAGMPTPAFMSEVSAGSWLDVVPPLDQQTILEEARYFSALDMGMSLLWLHRSELLRNI